MRMLEFFRSSAVRVALAFVLVTTVATTAVFGLVYFRIGEANEARNRLILETEAAKSVNRSVEELRGAFEVRLTNDLRRCLTPITSSCSAISKRCRRFRWMENRITLPQPPTCRAASIVSNR